MEGSYSARQMGHSSFFSWVGGTLASSATNSEPSIALRGGVMAGVEECGLRMDLRLGVVAGGEERELRRDLRLGVLVARVEDRADCEPKIDLRLGIMTGVEEVLLALISGYSLCLSVPDI